MQPDAAGPGQPLPLWMIEGLAEYGSVGRDDPQTAMWLRDALAFDYLPGPADFERDLTFGFVVAPGW